MNEAGKFSYSLVMASGCEWVDNPLNCSDEEDLFEAESTRPRVSAVLRLGQGDAQTSGSCAEEDAYFGDDLEADPSDESTNPVELLRLYAERSFPNAVPFDFCGDVHRQSIALGAASSKKSRLRGVALSPPGLTHTASRAQRISLLRQQIEDLEREEAADGEPSTNAEAQSLSLGKLRECLSSLSEKRHDAVRNRRCLSVSTERVTSQLAHTDHLLEKRIARLESSFTACACLKRGGLWYLVQSVRLQMQNFDSSFWSDVHRKVDSLTSSFEEVPALANGVDVCELLQRLDEIEPDASCIPVVISRLRSLKHSLEESSVATTTTADLAKRYDALMSTRTENEALLRQLRMNLDANMKTTRLNMESLETRLRKGLARSPDSD